MISRGGNVTKAGLEMLHLADNWDCLKGLRTDFQKAVIAAGETGIRWYQLSRSSPIYPETKDQKFPSSKKV
jgi:hypothetical protein